MKEKYQFLLRTLFYTGIILVLIYFFSYLGQSQGNFIYKDF